MVSRSYLLATPHPPSGLRRAFGQRVLPVAIDAASGVERMVEGIARRTRRHPKTMLWLAAGAGFMLSLLTAPRGQSRR